MKNKRYISRELLDKEQDKSKLVSKQFDLIIVGTIGFILFGIGIITLIAVWIKS